MRSFEQLEAMWLEDPRAPRSRGTVRLICVRKGVGEHQTPASAELSPERGLHGDRWELELPHDLGRQVTLMSARVAELVAGDAQPLHMAGDNFLVDLDLSEHALPVGVRLRLGAALIEITAEPHTGCRRFSARFGQGALRWVNWRAHRERRLRGVNCRVIEPGAVAVGDLVTVE
jgi:MOSC domain-containing protein YiiM